MEKTHHFIKSILTTFLVILFVFSVTGTQSEAKAFSDTQTIDVLKQQIADIQSQIIEKQGQQIDLIKQQVTDIRAQTIELFKQRITDVQSQIAEKQKQIASLTPAEKIDILKQQIVDVQAQIGEKQEELAKLTSFASASTSTPFAEAPLTPFESERTEEKITQELSKGGFIAAISNFFNANNFCQPLFIIAIVIIGLAALALFRSREKDKNWFPYLIILITPFLYRGFCSNNWLILLGLSIILLIIDWMLQGNKERQAKIEFLK